MIQEKVFKAILEYPDRKGYEEFIEDRGLTEEYFVLSDEIDISHSQHNKDALNRYQSISRLYKAIVKYHDEYDRTPTFYEMDEIFRHSSKDSGMNELLEEIDAVSIEDMTPDFLVDQLTRDLLFRKVAIDSNKFARRMQDSPEEAFNIVDKHLLDITKIRDSLQPSIFTEWEELKDEVVKVSEEAIRDRDSVFYPTGLDGLEELHGWNKNSDYVIIAGRPNHGKSMFLCKFVATLLKFDKTVAFYTGEMEKFEVMMRIYSILTGESTNDLLYGRSEEALERFKLFMTQNPMKLIMASKKEFGNRSPNAIQLKAFAKKANADVLCLDQVSFIDPIHRKSGDWRDTAAISRELKMIRDELNIPVLLVSQLNRTKAQEGDVDLIQLAGSDVLGQDATKVLGIDYKKDTNITTLSIVKNRSGKAYGSVKFNIDYDHGQFRRPEDVSKEIEGEGEIEWMK